VVLLVLAIAAAGSWLSHSATAINRANFDMIHDGMTLPEVEAILGGPARSEQSGPWVFDIDHEEAVAVDREVIAMHQSLQAAAVAQVHTSLNQWASDRLIVWVEFDGAGLVKSSTAMAIRRSHESPLAVLRRWLSR
jgi:hypothetical protein